jgi:hypothetical protein
VGILAFFRSLFYQSNKTTENIEIGATLDVASSFELPLDIANEENIARYIFSPINVNPKNNNLKNNCFKPPPGYDEISVNRYDYTDESFLKNLGLEMQNPMKEFYGLAIFKAESIFENDFQLIYTPIPVKNKFHSDIKIGYVVEKDVELPAEINEKIRNILKKTKLFKDTDISTCKWVGDEIKL